MASSFMITDFSIFFVFVQQESGVRESALAGLLDLQERNEGCLDVFFSPMMSGPDGS
jgi:hypothetical protein